MKLFGNPIVVGHIYTLISSTYPVRVEVLEVNEGLVKYKILLDDRELFEDDEDYSEEDKIRTLTFKLLFREIREADWIGKPEKRFNWRTPFKSAWGRWHYKTDCSGKTTDKWWVWER